MNAELQPWTVHLQAKTKGFDLKFKATRYLPTCCNLFQFSLFLKISSVLIRLSSDNNHSTRRKSLNSKITEIIEKFRSRPTKKKSSAAHKSSRNERLKRDYCEGPICFNTVVIGKFALLVQSIYEKDIKGIIVHCSSIMLYALSRLRTFIGRKKNMLLLFSIVAMLGYPLLLHMKNNLSYGERTFSWRYIGKAWSWAASNSFYHKIASNSSYGKRTAWRYIGKAMNWAASNAFKDWVA